MEMSDISKNYPKSSFTAVRYIKGNSVKSNKQNIDYSKGIFVPAWVVLILVGVAIEFLGRLFGYEGNPTAIYHTWIPLGTASLGGIIAICGYFTFIGAKERQSSLRRRNGVLLIVMGFLMLASSFLFKMAIPLIFG